MNLSIGEIGVAGALLAAVLAAPSASAEQFSFPGNQCVRDRNGGGSIAYELERAVNPHTTQSAVFRCPVFRDQADATTLTALSLSGVDQNATGGQSVQCFLRSCDINAGSCSVSSTLASGGGNFVLNFNQAIDGDVSGYAYYTCTVPPASNGNASSVRAFTWDD